MARFPGPSKPGSQTDDLLQVGDRIRLSELGESRFPRAKKKSGTVIGFGYSENGVRVRIDGRSQPMTLHRTYLVKVQ